MIVKLFHCADNVLFLGMNLKFLYTVMAAAVLILLVAFATGKENKGDFEAAREVIVMRKIAHQVLLYTGDSTSRILPVRQLSANEFQIPFESSFSFTPDSLVKIIDRVIADNKLPSNYIVNVKACGTEEVIYGYAFLGSKQENIVPCSGRKQPDMRYCIHIRFQENKLFSSKTLYISGISLIGAGLLLFGLRRFKRGKSPLPVKEPAANAVMDNDIRIGQFLFRPEEQLLLFRDEKIVLTIKESKLLSIFAAVPNQTIDRNRLQKEVWEDEGVIVGRSLDMFISRLRKKLENDPNVKLTNIHGKGYKLEVHQGEVI